MSIKVVCSVALLLNWNWWLYFFRFIAWRVEIEAGATFDNSFFDNSFGFLRQFKNRSFLDPTFFSQKRDLLVVEVNHFWIVEEEPVERSTCSPLKFLILKQLLIKHLYQFSVKKKLNEMQILVYDSFASLWVDI